MAAVSLCIVSLSVYEHELGNVQPDKSASIGDLRCLGLEAGRQRRNGNRVDLGSVVRVGIDLLAGEGVSWKALAWSPCKQAPA